MKKVRFNGPSEFLEVDDKTIARGESEILSNETAERLEAHESIDVTVTDEPDSTDKKKEAR